MRVQIRLMLAVILSVLALACFVVGRAYRNLSSTDELLATLQYRAAERNSGKGGWISRFGTLGSAASSQRAIAAYWSKNYESLSGNKERNGTTEEPDPQERFIASNAAYRRWQLQAGTNDRQTSLARLDEVLKDYEGAMKASPQNVDASYNYEFVVRQREALIRNAAMATTLSSAKASIHGLQGALPKASNMGQFKVIVPQRPEERKEDKQAGKAERLKKKG